MVTASKSLEVSLVKEIVGIGSLSVIVAVNSVFALRVVFTGEERFISIVSSSSLRISLIIVIVSTESVSPGAIVAIPDDKV